MIYLIGGPPRIGKSIIAKKLADTIGAKLFSTDELAVPLNDLPALSFSGKADENTLTPTERVTLQVAHARLREAAVNEIIAKAINTKQAVVIEGIHLLPDFAEDICNKYGAGSVKAIFIGSIDIELILQGMAQNTNPHDWLKEANDIVRRQVALFTVAFSHYLRTETSRLGLFYKERTQNFMVDAQSVVPLKVAGCFIEYDCKILLLHRWPYKSEGDKWGLPAGKVGRYETNTQAILREIREETGYVALGNELEYLGEWAFLFPEKSLLFPTFKIRLTKPLQVVINHEEHQNFQWLLPGDILKLKNLVHGLQDLLHYVGYV